MNTLRVDSVIELVTKTPKQPIFDWKTDIVIPNDDEKRGDFMKDLDPFVNAIGSTYGAIAYGADLRRPDPVVGITSSSDDANLQQLTNSTISSLPLRAFKIVRNEVEA